MISKSKFITAFGLACLALLNGCAGSQGLSTSVEGQRCQGVLIPGIILNVAFADGNPADPARQLSVVFARGNESTIVTWTTSMKETRLSSGYWSRESQNFYEEFIPDAQGGHHSQGAFDGFEGLAASGPIRVEGPSAIGDFQVTINHSQYQPQLIESVHVDGDPCRPVTKTVDVTLVPR